MENFNILLKFKNALSNNRPSKYSDWLAIVFILIVTASFISPFLSKIDYISPNPDWVLNFTYAAADNLTINTFSQPPINSYHFNGGYLSIANPFSVYSSPLGVIVHLTNEVIGIKLIVLLYIIIGCLGCYLFSRKILKFNLISSVYSTLTFIMCSWWPVEARSGSFNKFHFYLFPLLLYLIIRAVSSKKAIIGSVCIVSVLIIHSALLQFNILFFIFLYTTSRVFFLEGTLINKMKLLKKQIITFIFIVLCASLICMYKILPTIYQITLSDFNMPHQNISESYSNFKLKEENVSLLENFNNIINNVSVSSDQYHDYGHGQIYLGHITILFCFISLLFYFKSSKHFLFLILFFGLLISGSGSFINIHKVLWHLYPPFKQIYKLDKNFVVYFFFLISLLAGNGLNNLMLHLRKPFILSACIVLAILNTANLFISNRWLYSEIFTIKKPIITETNAVFANIEIVSDIDDELTLDNAVNHYSLAQYYYVLSNLGTINAAIPFSFKSNVVPKYYSTIKKENWRAMPMNADWYFQNLAPNPDYKGEIFSINKGIKLNDIYYSPNLIKFSALVNFPDILTLNRNFDPFWSSNIGKLYNCSNLLCLKLDQHGKQSVVIKYVSQPLKLGIIISVLSLIIFGYIYWKFD